MVELTKEQKEKIIELRGYEKQIGYIMEYEVPEYSQNVFITKEEWEQVSKYPPKECYWNPHSEYMTDLDGIWEQVEEDIYDELDTNSEEEFEEYCLKLLKN